MVFSDLFFLFVFLPAFILLYLLAALADKKFFSDGLRQSNLMKNLCIVLFSLIFYAWGEPVYVFLMLGSVFVNYLAGLAIDRREGARSRKAALAAGVACNLLVLGTFKYAGFFAETLSSMGLPVRNPGILLPIGISFYTFQSISYLVDVYRRESPVQHKFYNLLLYISMFPQLIAGPIVRYGTVASEILSRRVTASDLAEGSYRFLVGLGKKVILANQLSELSGQFLGSAALPELSTTGAWIGLLAFMLQIYFDFSGYSDMAIGMGRCLGFHFNENFNHPYCCDSITDFWRRWHMSLGSFFRDYVYIPLGGNRRHQPLNILAVWFLTGMWHGASWNFIIWGLYFGLIIMTEKHTLLRVKERIPAVVLHAYSLLVVYVGWGIFYFDNFAEMQSFFAVFFGRAATFTDFVSEAALANNFWLWLVALVLCLPLRGRLESLLGRCAPLHLCARVALSAGILVLSVALLVGATNNTFLYTRF